MFFYLAKGLWFLLQPSTLIALLIGYGAILIWTGWARWGRRFVTIGAILLFVAGLSPPRSPRRRSAWPRPPCWRAAILTPKSPFPAAMPASSIGPAARPRGPRL